MRNQLEVTKICNDIFYGTRELGLAVRDTWWWCRPAKYSLNLSIIMKS